MPPLQLPDTLGKLFYAVKYPKPAIPTPHVVHKGSIVNFHYIGQQKRIIHDPYPLVLVSDTYSNALRGINLNYLDVPYVKAMINNFLEKQFSYSMIKNDNYIVDAFRTYKVGGISQLRMMDSEFLRGIAAISRTLDPNELDQIRMQIEQLIKDQVNQPVAQPGEVQI